MNPSLTVSRAFSTFAAGLSLYSLPASAAERFHLEPLLPSSFPPGPSLNQTNPFYLSESSTILAGGNVANYPNSSGAIPHDTANRFFLAESSLGYSGPTTQGGFSTYQDLTALAGSLLSAGTTYDAVGSVGVPGNWKIVFPGVVNVADGTIATNSTPSNFDPDKVRSASSLYIALSKSFSNDLLVKIAYVNSLRELIGPYTFAGNNAYARATKERQLYGSDDAGNAQAYAREDDMLQRAVAMFDVTLSEFAAVFGSADSASAGFPAAFPPISTVVPSEVAAIMAQRDTLTAAQKEYARSVARAMNQKAETLLRLYSLRYFQQYDQNTFPNLINDIDQQVASFQYTLLLASTVGNPQVFSPADLAPTKNLVASLLDLKSAILRKELKFTSQDFNGASEIIRTRNYHSRYIPFAVDVLIDPTKPTTTSALLAKAQTFAGKAIAADAAASGDIARTEENLADLAVRLSQVGTQYQTQLAQLCGRRDDGNGELVPDLEGAIFPPERRQAIDKGEIGQAWYSIGRAELALDAAWEARNAVTQKILLKQETWKKIKVTREDLLQNSVLPTGEKLAEIERQSAEAQAKFTEYQASLAKKKKKRGLFGSIIQTVAGAAAAYVTGGLSAIATSASGATLSLSAGGGGLGQGLFSALGGLAGAATDYSIAGLGIKELRGQADLQRQQGEFNAKRIELQTLQQAAILSQGITEEGYRTEENIQLLLIEAKAAEMNILSAEIAVDQEYSRLESLLNQVSFLLQQQASILNLVNTNPLNSPDYRLVRNLSVRNSEARFNLAQEYAFLAGRAASYIALGTDKINEISNINSRILKARTGARLDALLDLLDAAIFDITLKRGARTLPNGISISLRDHLIQRNLVSRAIGTGNATPNVAGYAWEAQTAMINGVVESGASERLSDAAWKQTLQDSFIDDGFSHPRLEIPFKLTLDRWGGAALSNIKSSINRIKNPLYSSTDYGQLIWYNPNIPNAFGVRVQILGSELTNVGGEGDEVTVSLSAEGTSYVRNTAAPAPIAGQPLPASDTTIQWYQFGLDQSTPSTATIVANVGSDTRPQGNQQLHERSPANDRWVLRIYSNDSNDKLLRQLQNIRDIRIVFAISGYTGTP